VILSVKKYEYYKQEMQVLLYSIIHFHAIENDGKTGYMIQDKITT
jgi:hypothetical protein